MPPATFAISTKDDDGINAANNAGSVTAARLVRRFMWNCPEMIPVSEKASTKNDVSRASRINRSAQTPATDPRALRSPTPAISVTSSDAAMVDTQISRQTIRLAKSPPKMALFIRQASLHIPRASSGTANSAVSENVSILNAPSAARRLPHWGSVPSAFVRANAVMTASSTPIAATSHFHLFRQRAAPALQEGRQRQKTAAFPLSREQAAGRTEPLRRPVCTRRCWPSA